MTRALLTTWVNPDGDEQHAAGGGARWADEWEGGSGELRPEGTRVYTGRVVVMVLIYLVRTGLMNCTYPL